jgi:hypothetical protein
MDVIAVIEAAISAIEHPSLNQEMAKRYTLMSLLSGIHLGDVDRNELP